MEVRKFKGHLITDAQPKIGDTTICTNRKSCNYGLTSTVQTTLIENDDWKVIVPQDKAFDVLSLVEDTKQVQKEFKKIGVHWSLKACLDSVIEKRSRIVFYDVKAMALQLLEAKK